MERTKDFFNWSEEQVSDWLRNLGGGFGNSHASSFRNNGVDGLMLTELDHEHLQNDLGVKQRLHRKRILREITVLVKDRDEFLNGSTKPHSDEPKKLKKHKKHKKSKHKRKMVKARSKKIRTEKLESSKVNSESGPKKKSVKKSRKKKADSSVARSRKRKASTPSNQPSKKCRGRPRKLEKAPSSKVKTSTERGSSGESNNEKEKKSALGKNFPKKLEYLVDSLHDLDAPEKTALNGCPKQKINEMFGDGVYEKLCDFLELAEIKDLVQYGVFELKGAFSKEILTEFRTCAEDIIYMIKEQFRRRTSHDLCEDTQEKVNLREVWLRDETLDFVIWHWKEVYPVLDCVVRNPPWQNVIDAISKVCGKPVRCLSAGIFRSPVDSEGQNIHRDGHNYKKITAFPTSLTITVPLHDIVRVGDKEDDISRHNGATEFYPGSHVIKSKGPFKKCAILPKAGTCVGWGFDLAHCGGPNDSGVTRYVAYFVYHSQGAEKSDRNLRNFENAGCYNSLFGGTYKHIDNWRSNSQKRKDPLFELIPEVGS